MKKTFLGKLLIVATIIVLLLNFYLLPPVQANWLEDMLTSVISLLTLPIRAVAVACGWAINALTAGLAYMEGTTDGSAISNFITPFDILFNKVQLFDINFFDIKTAGTEAESLVNQIRLGIAGWYYALRNIAASILLCILIYVGIRMAITTIATDKAMYKKMLVDWVASMVLLFLMHYIMIFTINVNNTIINALSSGINSAKIEQIYDVVKTMALDPWDLNGIAATAIYCMLVWQTLGLVFAYFNRLLKLAFLTIIAPLVTITYSLDKMGDGKAQALNNWLKEYIYTILIQPFHCVIYMSLIDIGLNVLIDNAATGDDINVLAAAVISMMCVKFTKDGEQIVRKIFAFQDDGSTGLGAGLMVAGAGLKYAKDIGRTARSTVNGARNLARTGQNGLRHLGRGAAALGRGIGQIGQGAGNAAKAAAVTAMAAGQALKADENDNTSFSERKSNIRAEMDQKKLEKQKYKAHAPAEDDAKVEAEAQKLMEKNPKMTKKEAVNKVRLNAAKNNRAKDKKERKEKSLPARAIRTGRRTLSRLQDIRENSSVIKGLSDTAKFTISAGTGMFMGSGAIGVGQDVSAAIGYSAAMFKSTNEYMKGTRTTLRRGVAANFKAMGINSQKGVNAALPGILNLHGDPDEAKAKEDEIMKEIENALAECGLDVGNKSFIRNNIQRAAKSNPAAMGNLMQNMLGNMHTADGKTGYDNEKLHNACNQLSDFYNGQQIYKSFETAANFGLKPDTFAVDVMKSMPELEQDQTVIDASEPAETPPTTETTTSGGASDEGSGAPPQGEPQSEETPGAEEEENGGASEGEEPEPTEADVSTMREEINSEIKEMIAKLKAEQDADIETRRKAALQQLEEMKQKIGSLESEARTEVMRMARDAIKDIDESLRDELKAKLAEMEQSYKNNQ